MSTWFERFKKLRIEKELTQQEIADALEKDITAVSRYENGKGSKNMPFVFKKNLTNLFTNGELRYIETGEKAKNVQSNEEINSNSIPVNTDKFIPVPIVSARASGSPVGEIHYDVVTQGEVSIDRALFKVLPDIKHVQAVRVVGNSMSPRINEGDMVIIDRSQRSAEDGVFVLQYDSMLLVKRLHVTSRGIKIISDNRSYPEDTYDPHDNQCMFQIVGKVIVVVNTDMSSF